MPCWVLNISKNGDSTASVDNLSQCSATLTLYFSGMSWNSALLAELIQVSKSFKTN